MVAEKNDYMASAIETVYLSNEDYNVRKIARERDEFLRHQAYREAKIAKQEEIIAEKDSIIAEMDNTMKKQDSEIAALKEEVAKLEAQISDTKQ